MKVKTLYKKVIFLDVDGVINSGNNQKRNAELGYTCETMYFDSACMKNLKEIVEKADATLVLSSDWRFPTERTKSICHLQNLMKKMALYEIGITDQTGEALSSRNEEINQWLQSHKQVESYVILDDVNDCFEGENLKRLVLTDEIVGLTDSDVVKAIEILNKKIDKF